LELLSEELLLVAFMPEKGRASAHPGGALDFGLAGGVVMDLVLREAVRLEGKKLVAADPRPQGDDVLDNAVVRIRSSQRPRDPKHWVVQLGRARLKDQLLHRLVGRAVLGEREERVLGLFRTTRHELLDPAPRAALLERVERALLGEGDLDARLASLVSLVSACGLVDRLVAVDRRRDARQRARAIAAGDVGGQAVSSAIRAAQDATTAAVMAAAATDGGGGGHGGHGGH
jgi:hypothetical protein